MPEALAPIKLGRDTARRSLGAARGVLAVVGSLAAHGVGWAARRFRARPTSTIAGAAFAALMVGIGLNALVLQKARHPAPLFEAPVQDAQAPETAPAAATAPADQAAAAPPAAGADTLDRAPTGTLPPNAGEAAAPAPAADQPADAAPPAPSAAPAARAAGDDAPAPKPKKRRHPKSAAKKAKGHDKISQFLADPKSERRRHKARAED